MVKPSVEKPVKKPAKKPFTEATADERDKVLDFLKKLLENGETSMMSNLTNPTFKKNDELIALLKECKLSLKGFKDPSFETCGEKASVSIRLLPKITFGTFDKPAEEPAGKPAEEPAEVPAEKPAEEPAGKRAGKRAGKPAEERAGKPAEERAGKPAGKPAEERAGKPAGKPAGKHAEEPVAEPAEEPEQELRQTFCEYQYLPFLLFLKSLLVGKSAWITTSKNGKLTQHGSTISKDWSVFFSQKICYGACVKDECLIERHVCPVCMADVTEAYAICGSGADRFFHAECLGMFKQCGEYLGCSATGFNYREFPTKELNKFEKSKVDTDKLRQAAKAAKEELEAFKATAKAKLKAVKAVSEAKLKAVEAVSEAKLKAVEATALTEIDQAKFETEVAKKTLSNTKRRNGIH